MKEGISLKELCSKLFNESEIKNNLNRDIDTFIIVEKICKKELVKNFSEDFISTGCKNFKLFGKYAFEWELALDESDIEIFGDFDDVAMTSVIENFDDFAEEINETILNNTGNVFLFYDDLTTYNKVKKSLERLKKETK